MRIVLSAFAFLMVLVSSSFGQIVITFTQDGANVTATTSGSANLTGLTGPSGGAGNPSLIPSELGLQVLIGAPSSGALPAYDRYTGISGPNGIGTGTTEFSADSGSGSIVGIAAGFMGGALELIVPDGYTSGTSIASTSTWNSTTIAGLGLTPGDYTWTWNSGAESLTISVVPEPSTFGAIIGGFALAGALFRRRRRVVSA